MFCRKIHSNSSAEFAVFEDDYSNPREIYANKAQTGFGSSLTVRRRLIDSSDILMCPHLWNLKSPSEIPEHEKELRD